MYPDRWTSLTQRDRLDDPMAEEPPIGMSAAEAKRRLTELSGRRSSTIERMRAMGVNPYGDGIPPEYIRLQNELAGIDRTIDETREWYLVRVTESLDESSQRLKDSSEKQLAATTALHRSSRGLEALTSALFILTTILAVVGSGSYFLQALREAGVTGLLAVIWASIGTLIVALLVLGSLIVLRRRFPELSRAQ